MKTLLQQGALGTLLLAAVLGFVPLHSRAQESAVKRRLVSQSVAVYPTLARSMALQGIVKVEAVVAADGSVKAVNIKGGHPVLAQAAVNTVRQWRWEPASHESHEIAEVRFAPE
jgi:periplasmic protein TonB